ncbi:hypothetical protein EVAR_17338_1 [Eumeta japonica]|uniref:Uncharacterized protein n=1 Tax=Eumeta variegata TaxID=151549 RepID=A0A4C1SQV5_EUMVA|nr:hypothetical protein EVAR_17338_1 [Eumeta japonica]
MVVYQSLFTIRSKAAVATCPVLIKKEVLIRFWSRGSDARRSEIQKSQHEIYVNAVASGRTEEKVPREGPSRRDGNFVSHSKFNEWRPPPVLRGFARALFNEDIRESVLRLRVKLERVHSKDLSKY